MSKTINHNIHPKDGYFFKESDGSRHFADTWKGVIERVKRYRARAGYPPGNPEEEVINQACQRNPVICREDNGVNTHQLKIASLKSRTLNWMNAIRAGEKSFVEEGLARKRAAICAGCPKNQPLQDGCSSCRNALKALRRDIIGDRFVDGRLNSCLILGEDLSTTAHLDQATHEFSELPEHCWRKRKI